MNKKYLYEIKAVFNEKEAKEQALQKKEKEKKTRKKEGCKLFFTKEKPFINLCLKMSKELLKTMAWDVLLKMKKNKTAFPARKSK